MSHLLPFFSKISTPVVGNCNTAG